MARLSSELVLGLTDKVSGPARGVGRALDRLENRHRSTNSMMRHQNRLTAESATSMSRASTMALAGAARAFAPIAGAYGAGSIVREAADFETAMTNIQKKAGATAEQTARLGEEIKDLATSGEVAVSIEELAAAFERGAAAGIPLDELRQFALLSAKAADAFEMSAESVGNAAAGFNKGLGVEMGQMERLFDLINGLADSGIADESDIVEFLDRAGAMSKTFGLTVDQTAALGAALTNLKVPASQAATAMNSILTKLLAPNSLSKRGFKAFRRLTGDTEAFAKKVSVDADGALVDIVQRLKQLDKASRTEIIADLFGQEHLDVMSQLVEGSDELIRNLKYAEDQAGWANSLDKSYQLKLDDFWSQWTIAKNSLSELMIDAGNLSMPALKRGLEEARRIFDEIGAGMENFEAQVNWQELDEARTAVYRLRDEIGALLKIDTSGSNVGGFFSQLAAELNTISATVNRLDKLFRKDSQVSDVVPRALSPEEQEDMRFKALKERVRGDQQKRQAPIFQAMPDWLTRDRPPDWALSDYDQKNWDRARKAIEEDDRQVKTPPKTGRLPETGRPPAPINPDRFGGHVAPPVEGPIPASRPVPIPTPRPNVEGAVTEEGEKAALKAQEIGNRISQAFSVTATPQVDTASIDEAQRKVNALAASMRELQGISGGVSRSVEGIHADTGRF